MRPGPERCAHEWRLVGKQFLTGDWLSKCRTCGAERFVTQELLDDGTDAACFRGDHVWMDVGPRGVTVEQECQFCTERRQVKMDVEGHTPEPEFDGLRDDRGGEMK